MKAMIKDYPRPQFVRPNWQNLNGSWDFAFDDQNQGEAETWYNTFPLGQTIQVPFTYETKLSGIQDETRHDNVWYSRTITVTAADLEQTVLLHFEGSDYTTKLWVNGQHAGSHTGPYARFSFDITNLLTEGENMLTVKVEDSADEQQPRGKQRWQPDNFGCWYVQTTGIWKTVWLETRPRTALDYAKITPVLSEKRIALEVDVAAAKYDASLTVEAVVSFDGTFINSVRMPVRQRHMTTSIDVFSTAVDDWGIRTWAPQHPDLYDLTLILREGDTIIDTVDSYFGMREIRIDGQNILLNGAPLYQRLILDQGYWKDSHLTPPDEQALITDIERIQALGYNGVRKHQKVEDERFLYWCDVKGMLVWSEVGAAYLFSDYAVSEFTRQWMEIVRQQYNHPSIITWTPFNESWGVSAIKTNYCQQVFTESIYYLTKAFDPNRPVIVNDGWEHTISDIITLHDYEASGEEFLKRYTEFKEEILESEVYHSGSKSAFADGYGYQGQPILISEFGGIAFNNDDSGWGYGDKVQTEEAFIARFDSITTAIKELPYCCGYCYTQVTDVQQEINGLMDIDRNYKVNVDAIHEINLRPVGIYGVTYR